MKHIESIQPEYAAYDLERIFREEGDATATAALTRLLHDWTGCDIPQTDTTPQSDVDELVPLAVSILRRHWQTPLTCLGSHPNGNTGVEPLDLADLFRQLIGDRVQGNEAWCIPPVHDNIPTAVSALRQRDMSSGLTLTLGDGTTTTLPDGISLAQVLGSAFANNINEITDTNIGWAWTNPLNLSSAKKVTLGCVTLDGRELYKVADGEIHLPFCEYANQNSNSYASIYCEKIYLEGFKYGWFRLSGSSSYSNKVTKYLYIGCQGDRTQTIGIYNYDYDTSNAEVHNSVNVEDIEIRQGTRQPLIISNSTIVYWEKLSREKVREHIIDRLADNSDGEPIRIQLGTILSKLTEEDIAVATNKNYNLISF